IRHDHHDDHVWGEGLDEGGEGRVADLHAVEGRADLAAGELELLDDVADLLKPVHVAVLHALRVRDHLGMESRLLKQEDFVSVQDGGEVGQVLLELPHVGDQLVHDRRPRL
ncbi:hypothetical protein EGW08_002294, partial [Elysia chlorotica]